MNNNKRISSNNVDMLANANPEEENKMANKFNEELANIIAEVVGNEIKMEEEVKMKKVSILERFASHHNRADKVEVVVERLEEEKEMERASIVAKLKEENRTESLIFNIEFKEESKRVEETVLSNRVNTVVSKVNDFFAPKEESSAPVEEVVEEDSRSAQELFDSIVERTNVFFPKGAFDAALEEEEEEETEEELLERKKEYQRKIELNNIRRKEIEEELTGLGNPGEKIKTLESEIEVIRAQMDFIKSQKIALASGVNKEDILKSKAEIDAYFNN